MTLDLASLSRCVWVITSTETFCHAFVTFLVDFIAGFCKKCRRFGWRIVFFSGIPHPHLLGEPLPESLRIANFPLMS